MRGAKLARRGALAVALVLGLAGCPLQSSTTIAFPPALAISVTSGAPLVGDQIMLTASFAPGGVDLASATWTTSNAKILSLASTKGATISATAVAAGFATVTVTSGSLRGAVAITVLDSVGDVTIVGPTALAFGADATYSATVTDATGTRPLNATVTWEASDAVAFTTPGTNTGSSIQIHAADVGNGTVTAAVGGRAAQVAVKVVATSGQLVITRTDGTAIPTSVGAGAPFTVQASYAATNELAADANWTYTGACILLGTSGATLSVEATGSGACTLTAAANDMQATATFQIVSVTGIEIVGDTGPLAIGDSRMFNAIGLAGTMETGDVAVTWSTGGPVLSLQPGATVVKVTGTEVGTAPLTATLPGSSTAATVQLTVAPVSIQLTAPGGRSSRARARR